MTQVDRLVHAFTGRAGRTFARLAMVGLLADPAPVSAHLVTTGLGPYYDGIGHLLLTPQDMLPLIALALLAGLGGPGLARAILFAVPVAWLAGGLLGLTRTEELALPLLSTASVLLVGGLVAADREPSLRVGASIGIAIALVHGFLNGTAMGAAGLGSRAVLGITCTAFVVIALVAAAAVSLRTGWTRIAVRVAGSWIVATGLLMLGWTLR